MSEADNKQLLPNRVRFFLLGTGAPAPSVGKLGRSGPRCQTKRTISTKGRHRTRCTPARARTLIANEPRNLRLGRAQSHISFGPVTEKNVEQVDPPWPRPQ